MDAKAKAAIDYANRLRTWERRAYAYILIRYYTLPDDHSDRVTMADVLRGANRLDANAKKRITDRIRHYFIGDYPLPDSLSKEHTS